MIDRNNLLGILEEKRLDDDEQFNKVRKHIYHK
jgi:hypothetical protein